MSQLADDLERLCCAETEGKFFDLVTDNIATIVAALRTTPPASTSSAVGGTASTKPDAAETKAAYDLIVQKSEEMALFAGSPNPQPDAVYKAAWEAYVDASMLPEVKTYDCIKRAVEAAFASTPPAATDSAGVQTNWPRAIDARRHYGNSWHADISFARYPTDDEIDNLREFLGDHHIHTGPLYAHPARGPDSTSDAVATVTYTNYRGETSARRIIPKSVRYGSTEWHPEPQWLLLAWDDDKKADREFALKDFGARGPDREAMEDLSSHRRAWRHALEIARDHALTRTNEEDDRSYWEHEIRAFDRTFDALAEAK